MAFVLQCILASLPNISAVSFLNPFEVLEATAKEAFDLIITDYSMPEMDGITLARQLHAQHPATKIVMLTAYGTTPETSADDVLNATLSKPIASQTLRRFVTDLLGNAPLQPSHINH